MNKIQFENIVSLDEMRNSILNKAFLILAVVMLPIIFVMIKRSYEFGFGVVQYAIYCAYIFLVIVTLFRNKIKLMFKSSFIIVLTFILGVMSATDWGLIGGYAIFFITAITFTSQLFGRKIGLVALIIILVTMIVFAVLFHHGLIKINLDYNGFQRSYYAWAMMIFSVGLLASLILLGFDRIYGSYISSMNTIVEKSRDLEQMNKQLKEEMAERLKAEEIISESEKKYKLLANNSTDMIWTMDMSLKPTYVSPQVESLRGFNVEEMMNQTLAEILTRDSYSNAMNAAREAIDLFNRENKLKKQVITVELELTKKDGSSVLTETRAKIIGDDNGRPISILGVTRDITERKKLEEQLIQAQKMEAVGRLAGGIAHDFNNQLTVILGATSLLKRKFKFEENTNQYVEMIKNAGEKSAALVNQLLAFSRKQVIEPKILELNKIVIDLKKMLKRLIGENIDLTFKTVEQPLFVKCDPSQIEQIIINLAINARDAMTIGGKLSIESAEVLIDKMFSNAYSSMPPGRYAMLSVSDTGCGMDKKTIDQIFEPFFTTKEMGRGTGLGLSTVYGIVDQLGGSIRVYSELNIGTTFKVYLPIMDEKGNKLDKPVERASEMLQCTGNILIVEDDHVVAAIIKIILSEHGYDVTLMEKAEEALNYFAKNKESIDLLITDVIMPKISGRQLVEECKSLLPSLNVLFISGYTDEIIAYHEMLEEGASFLQKPFTSDSLLLKVHEILEHAKSL